MCVYCVAYNYIVFRVEKIKPHLPKLIMPANESTAMQQLYTRKASPSPSPSPSPQPRVYEDPDFDPDNVVIRGAVTDDEDDNDNARRRGGADDLFVKPGELDDFSFKPHS